MYYKVGKTYGLLGNLLGRVPCRKKVDCNYGHYKLTCKGMLNLSKCANALCGYDVCGYLEAVAIHMGEPCT